MEILEMILLLATLVCAAGILLAHRVRTAVGMYLAFSVLLAIVWGLHYGLRLAITELGVGVAVTGLLLCFYLQKLRKEKGARHGG